MDGTQLTIGKWYRFYPWGGANSERIWYMKCLNPGNSCDNCKASLYVANDSSSSVTNKFTFHNNTGSFSNKYSNCKDYEEVTNLREVNQYLPDNLKEKVSDIVESYEIC